MTKSKRNKFANAIVIICMVMLALITLIVLYEYHRLDETMSGSALGVLVSAWTGELLILACRQIFGSNVVSQKQKPKDPEGDEFTSI